MSWNTLPTEIQAYILETLVQLGDSARYASTCVAWQTTIERANFACLKVTPARLADFSDIGFRHRRLVRSIWFTIEPSKHNCPWCGRPGVNNWYQVSSQSIRRAIQDLVTGLSFWESDRRVALDISVKAPSGLMHPSSTIQYGPPVILETPRTRKVIRCSHWMHDPDLEAPMRYLADRESEAINYEPEPEPESSARHQLPKARAVTSLFVRRQTRQFWKSEIVDELLDLLPEVREIYYEPWRDWRRMEQEASNTMPMRLSKSYIPDQLKHLVIFESFHGSNEVTSPAVRAAELDTARALVEASLTLEHLAASFITDATHFLHACRKWKTWPSLESLVLTSRSLTPHQPFLDVNDLLETMALVAMKMPRLKTMEVWNGGSGFAGVFQFRVSLVKRTATITWRGSWDLALEPRVLKAWQVVAFERVGCKLHVLTEILDSSVVITSLGGALHYLGLFNPVIHPVSLWQIEKETIFKTRRCHDLRPIEVRADIRMEEDRP